MATTKTILLSTLLTLSCGSPSQEDNSCKSDTDCPAEQLCTHNKCTTSSIPSLDELILERGTTDSNGQIIFQGQTLKVTANQSNIPNAQVFYLTNGPKADIIVIPPTQDYLPTHTSVTSSQETTNQPLINHNGTTHQSLGAEVIIALEAASIAGKLYDKSNDLPRGTLLNEDQYTRQICMSRVEIETSIANPITGVLEVTGLTENTKVTQFFGYFDSFKNLFFDILVPEFKEYSGAKGYIVVIPKHQSTLDIFAEVNSTDIIYTDLTTLQQEMEKMPYWRITGICNPEENPQCTFTAGKRCEGDILVYQNSCGEKQALQDCTEAGKICLVGSCKENNDTPVCAQQEAENSRYCPNSTFLYARDKCGSEIFIKNCEEQRDERGIPYRCRDGECTPRIPGCDGEETRVCEDPRTILYTNACGEPTRIDCDDNEMCEHGACIEQQEGPEILNGRDDDGDGQIDEGFVTVGNPQITLMWEGNYDLDLRVTAPDGCQIWYSNNNCRQGHLDRDARRSCREGSRDPPENIYWEEGQAPRGEYLIEVLRFDRANCPQPIPIDFIVRLAHAGTIQEYSSTLEAEANRMEVTRFNH